MAAPPMNPAGKPPAGSASSTEGGGAADPSMDEILASIRRILSEDEASSPAEKAPASPDAPEPASDVLALDESMMVAESKHDAEDARPPIAPPPAAAVEAVHHAPPAAAAAEPQLPPSRDEPHMAPEPVPAAPPAHDPPTHLRPASESLVAPEAASAAASALSPLFRKLSAERATEVYRGGPTLEEILREEMRPLLKQWLDANLPAVVERVVRAEIDRVVNTAGS